MSSLPLEVIEMLGGTIAKVIPITALLAALFSVLNHFWACNPGAPWWRRRELVTDLCNDRQLNHGKVEFLYKIDSPLNTGQTSSE